MVGNLRVTPVLRVAFPIFLGVPERDDVLLRILSNLYSRTRYTEMSITMAYFSIEDIIKNLIKSRDFPLT